MRYRRVAAEMTCDSIVEYIYILGTVPKLTFDLKSHSSNLSIIFYIVAIIPIVLLCITNYSINIALQWLVKTQNQYRMT